jgi:HK97 gp10 family phage protein
VATFILEIDPIHKAVELALEEWARAFVDEIVKITPRDPQRLPKNPNAKVTWNLKRSIQYEKISDSHFRVGVVGAWIKNGQIVKSWKWAVPAEYGLYLEFWTIRMKPRSFIRKALIDKGKEIQNIMNKVFKLYAR